MQKGTLIDVTFVGNLGRKAKFGIVIEGASDCKQLHNRVSVVDCRCWLLSLPSFNPFLHPGRLEDSSKGTVQRDVTEVENRFKQSILMRTTFLLYRDTRDTIIQLQHLHNNLIEIASQIDKIL